MNTKAIIISSVILAGITGSCTQKQQPDNKVAEIEETMVKESNDTIMKQFVKENLYWTREPEQYTITDSVITIQTAPNTDLWQRTYYGFSNDNAPVLQMKTSCKYFSFTVKTEFNSSALFDQCGIALYLDSDNWMKASIEYENEDYQRLGSVVTNNGYSDWATQDIPSSIKEMWYRLSRRGSDFYIETSVDGMDFRQMRTFHMFKGDDEISFGIYAASPVDHSFTAKFSEMEVGECKWKSWSAEDTGFNQTDNN